ncbi:MAG TPA: hypothetical protein VJ773_05600 [Gemmatimonadales bacterium]|nr:hypothetical protein [Gemmatimonadales bacterium]
MTHAHLPVVQPFRTSRPDAWWLPPLAVFLVLGGFVAYATWAALQNAHYTFGPYLSPFYSPELFGSSPHALLGPQPGWWPAWLPFSPAILILWAPGGFRFTCYYYRGAYYKSFWADPPACAVGEPRSSYRGEHSFPLVLQNSHRFFLILAVIVLVFLGADAVKAYRFADASGGTSFGIGIGSLLLTLNAVLLAGYTFGCHSFRHLAGGMLDRISERPVRKAAYDCSSCLNRRHDLWAWASLLTVAGSDLYVRLCSMGVIADWRIL